MAIDFSDETKQVKIAKTQTLNTSTDLKQMLSEKQLEKARQMYLNIRKSFYEEGCSLTRHDKELAEMIRLKILDMMLVEDF